MIYLLTCILGLPILIVFGLDKWMNSTNNEQRKFLDKIPGPTPYPVLGNILDFIETTNLFPVLMEYMYKYGNVVRVWFGRSNLKIVLLGQEVTSTILSSNINIKKSPDYEFFYNWFGDGLLTSSGERWRKFRKLLTPAFHFKILENFIERFEGPTEILIKKLKTQVGNKDFNIYTYMSLYSLDIICESSMGTTVNAQQNEESPYVKAVSEVARISIDRGLSPIKHVNFFYRLSRDFYKERAALKIVHGYTRSVIQKRKAILESTQNGSKGENVTSGKRSTLLDLLLTSKMDGGPIPDNAIREEVDTFMFKGHDTIAACSSYTFYLLANHPEIQEMAYQEQKTLFGNEKNPKLNFDDLKKMTFLELVIKESLRLYPPVPILGRQTIEDMEIDGVTYPKGLKYYINLYSVHRNPKYFENPDSFDPMRFSDNAGLHPYSYIPFSAGPRNCIGQRFAMLELKYVISAVLRHFVLEPALSKDKFRLALKLVLKSENGMKVSLKARE